LGFNRQTVPGDVIRDDRQGQEPAQRATSATSGAQKTAQIPPAAKATNVTATVSETGSRRTGPVADLSLGGAGIGRSIQSGSWQAAWIDGSKPGGDMTRWKLARLTTLAAVAATAALPALAAAPKYYFQMQPVKAGAEIDEATKTFAAEALRAELAARPEWASDVGPAGQLGPGQDRGALVAELKKRNLRGFDVTARIEKLKQEVKEPKPGARNKQLAVEVNLTVFGTTIPDAKLAFSGDGQSGSEAEVSEKRLAADTADTTHDVLKDAIKQAVDQAVLKLSLGKAGPMNERHRHKK
jgi:hypothetical protein